MTAIRRELADRIRKALPELNREAAAAVDAWDNGLRTPEHRDAYVDAAALSLHGYYTGLEKLLLMVLRRLGEAAPVGEGSHKQLLAQVSRPVEGVRPAVIPEEALPRLDELRRFWHLIRNVYVSELDAERVSPLIETVEWLRHDLSRHWLAFADFLDVGLD